MKRRFAVALMTVWLCPSFVRAQDESASKVSNLDDKIQYLVRVRLANDPDVKGGADEVSVSDGVVVIKGRVDTMKGKSKATKLARKVKGVKDVDNQLQVGPPA